MTTTTNRTQYDNGRTLTEIRRGGLGCNVWSNHDGSRLVCVGVMHGAQFAAAHRKPAKTYKTEATAQRAVLRWLDAGR